MCFRLPDQPYFCFCKIPDLKLFLMISEKIPANYVFFRNRLFYYKIVMAAHLLAATSLLTVRINKIKINASTL
jgi:hypothetical protein